MADIDSEIERLKSLSRQGRGAEKCHVILIEEEARKRKENPPDEQGKQKTKFVFETDDPSMYSRFNVQKDRWLKGRNKSVMVDLLCSLWEGPTDEQIERWASERPEQETLGDA
jgi:hypothetical protein